MDEIINFDEIFLFLKKCLIRRVDLFGFLLVIVFKLSTLNISLRFFIYSFHFSWKGRIGNNIWLELNSREEECLILLERIEILFAGFSIVWIIAFGNSETVSFSLSFLDSQLSY